MIVASNFKEQTVNLSSIIRGDIKLNFKKFSVPKKNIYLCVPGDVKSLINIYSYDTVVAQINESMSEIKAFHDHQSYYYKRKDLLCEYIQWCGRARTTFVKEDNKFKIKFKTTTSYYGDNIKSYEDNGPNAPYQLIGGNVISCIYCRSIPS
jgi:hypothetical protein